MAGLLGAGGAVRGLYYGSFLFGENVFVATSVVIYFGVDFSRTNVYYFNGFIHQDDLIYVLLLVVIGRVGTWIGKRILNCIRQKLFSRFSLILVQAVGVMTLVYSFALRLDDYYR